MSNDALRLLRSVWIPGPAKAVAMVLADHADDRSWSCYVSQETTAFEAGVSRRTAQRRLAWLLSEGLISIRERRGTNYGRDSNVTTLIEGEWRRRATGSKLRTLSETEDRDASTATPRESFARSPRGVTPSPHSDRVAPGVVRHRVAATPEAKGLKPNRSQSRGAAEPHAGADPRFWTTAPLVAEAIRYAQLGEESVGRGAPQASSVQRDRETKRPEAAAPPIQMTERDREDLVGFAGSSTSGDRLRPTRELGRVSHRESN